MASQVYFTEDFTDLKFLVLVADWALLGSKLYWSCDSFLCMIILPRIGSFIFILEEALIVV